MTTFDNKKALFDFPIGKTYLLIESTTHLLNVLPIKNDGIEFITIKFKFIIIHGDNIAL